MNKELLKTLTNIMGGNFNTLSFVKLALYIIVYALLAAISFAVTLYSFFFVETAFFVIPLIVCCFTLIASIANLNTFNNIFDNVLFSRKNVFYIILKSIFIRHKNTENTVHANLFYSLFSLNKMIDNIVFTTNHYYSRYEEAYCIQSVFFSYIYNNYKQLNEEDCQLIINQFDTKSISYNMKMHLTIDEFNEFFIILKHYQDNRAVRELGNKILSF